MTIRVGANVTVACKSPTVALITKLPPRVTALYMSTTATHGSAVCLHAAHENVACRYSRKVSSVSFEKEHAYPVVTNPQQTSSSLTSAMDMRCKRVYSNITVGSAAMAVIGL